MLEVSTNQCNLPHSRAAFSF